MANIHEEKLNKMGTQPIPKLMMSMSWPAILSMTIAALYNMVDSIYVSRISESALTAVSYIVPLQFIMISLAVGTGVGVNSLIARKLGARRYDEANRTASTSLLLSVMNWLIFASIGVFFAKPFMGIYTDDEVIFNYAVDYLRIITIFSFCAITEINLEKVLQSTGNMIAPMIISMSGCITNIILDPIFIFGYFGLPRLEVKGAAIATVIGQTVSLIVAVILLRTREHAVQFNMNGFRIDWGIIRDIYSVALPTIVMQSVASFVMIVYNWILSATPIAVAVLGVYGKIESFVFMPVFGLQQGALPLMAYNFGARNKKRMMDTLKVSIITSLVMISIGTAIFQLAPEVLLSLFHAEGEMMELGVAALREISLCFIPAAIGISIGTTFQATGHGVYMLMESLIRQVIGVLPLAYILYNFYGPKYTFYSYSLAEILGMAFGLIMFIRLYNKEIRDLDKVKTCD